MKSFGIAAARAAVIAGLTLGATVAHAAALLNGGMIQSASSGNWAVTWNAVANPTLMLDWTAPAGGNLGLLAKTVTFNALAPIDITFTQVDPFVPVDPAVLDQFGLRFKMNATVKNMSGVNWTTFEDKLIDGAAVTAAQNPSSVNNNAHPSNPHFHDDGSVFLNGAGTIGFNADAITNEDANNKKNLWDFSGGPGVANTDTWMVTNIGIHDWEVTAFKRSFILREQPNVVPEPSALALVAVGSLVVAGLRRRRSRKTATAIGATR